MFMTTVYTRIESAADSPNFPASKPLSTAYLRLRVLLLAW